jgi:hypothetical protein
MSVEDLMRKMGESELRDESGLERVNETRTSFNKELLCNPNDITIDHNGEARVVSGMERAS